MEAIRLRICSAFISSARICSLSTLIRPSRFLAFIRASFPRACFSVMVWSRAAMFSAIRSYSSFNCSDSCLDSSIWLLTIRLFSSSSRKVRSVSSISVRNRFTSNLFISSLSRRYSLADAACFSRGPTCFSSSPRMSETRTRFCFSSSNFFWAMAFLRLNFTIPAASSKSSLRSSGRPLKILSIWPWPMME